MPYNDRMKKTVAIIGGGPAGLMAAETLTALDLRVDVYDAMPSLGRKLLMAGKSGLNLTHAEPFESFVSRYGNRQAEVQNWLKDFRPEDLRDWAKTLGVETFVGTSGRVFPKEMKASPLLRAWLQRLQSGGVNFHLRHRWNGFQSLEALNPKSADFGIGVKFETLDGEKIIPANAVILALGGGSWARLGSDGAWLAAFQKLGVQTAPLRPANCGFNAAWSKTFREKFDGAPLKTVALTFEHFHQRGEFIITQEGVEGSLIYAASALIRDKIAADGRAKILLDLLPDQPLETLQRKLEKPRGSRSWSNHLEKTLGIKGVKLGLLYEFVPKEDFADAEKLAHWLKALPIPLLSPRPLDEAISSAGGVLLEELDEHLMLKKMSGIFCAGEMLDWEAPTGGYLLTACIASGRWAGMGAARWMKQKETQL
ncbi:MAG: TIGR03862 family flavoprotein [Anaerolineales bacterium]